jgi:4-amino-4-deoxy-L-arabinose transferase-like glycosyltransferase
VSSRVRNLDRVMLGTVIAVFAGFAIAYTRITPLGASPDELSHLHYITGISDHLRLPPADEPERQQPPLYYLLGAIVARLTGDDARLIRLVSVVLGVLTILTVYLVARRLFPLRPYLAVGAAGLVALLPETQYLAGAINDDNLAWLAGALLVLAGVVVMQSGVLSTRLALGAGLAVALAVLAKETVWVLALLLLVIVVVRFRRQLRALQIAALVLPSVVLAGWWFVRNAVAFGSPLPPLHPITAQRQVFDSLSQVRGYLAATALSIVGMYGNGAHFVAISILGARPLPSIVAGAVIALITLTACIAVVRSWGRWDTMRRRVAIVLLVVILVALAQSVLNSATFDLQPQARYLLVAVGAAAPITAWTIAWRSRGPLSSVRCAGIAMLVVVALLLDVSGLITAAHTAA